MGSESTLSDVETFDLISSTTILGVFYGITFVLYYLCAWSLYPDLQQPEKRPQARRSLGNISVLFVCATGYLVVNARLVQLAYINHADFPGGPFAYEDSYDSTTDSYFITVGIIDLIIQALTMAIQIRCLWIIWGRTRYAVAAIIGPVLLLLYYIAMTIPPNIINAFIPLDQLGILPMSMVAMATTRYVALSGCTILVTGLIAGRLLLERKRHRKIMGMSEDISPYLSIVAMLVESYMLDAAWSLSTAISYGLGDPSQFMFEIIDSTIKIIAYFLIVYRVETGRGWTKETGEKLTTLRWNRDGQTATDEVSSIRSRVPASTTMAAVDSLPTAHPDLAI